MMAVFVLDHYLTTPYRVMDENGTLISDSEPEVDSDILLRMMEGMLFLRELDERMLKLQRQGRIGFYGTATGQEAAVIGSALTLEPQDWVFPALREGGVALMRGYRLIDLVNQNYGNRADLLKGRQMPCHYSDRRVNHVAWSSCIGNQLPQATGAAMAARYRGDPVIVMAYLGDGATSEGDFHVALNFAGVFKAPVVFFCQNNQWAISVPRKIQTASTSIAIKALAYGMPGVQVDGNDVLAVYEVTREAVAHARRGEGPILIEAVTYRMGAHSTSDDPKRYRDEREVNEWRRRDPIRRFRQYLISRGLWDDSKEEAFLQRTREAIQQAVEIAEREPPPDVETLFDDVYAQMLPHLIEQKEYLLSYLSERDRWS